MERAFGWLIGEGAAGGGGGGEGIEGGRLEGHAEIGEDEARVGFLAWMVWVRAWGALEEDVAGFDVAVDDREPVLCWGFR